ncbi:unnamed protein product [Amoebophrya sp. A120]|nr:unnamed protein product [Amoebophrya sp. A120]|eukprot:GSA120T00020073001.1
MCSTRMPGGKRHVMHRDCAAVWVERCRRQGLPATCPGCNHADQCFVRRPPPARVEREERLEQLLHDRERRRVCRLYCSPEACAGCSLVGSCLCLAAGTCLVSGHPAPAAAFCVGGVLTGAGAAGVHFHHECRKRQLKRLRRQNVPITEQAQAHPSLSCASYISKTTLMTRVCEVSTLTLPESRWIPQGRFA